MRIGTRIIIPLNSKYKSKSTASAPSKKTKHKHSITRRKKHPSSTTRKRKNISSPPKVSDPTYKKYAGKFSAPVEGGKLTLKFHQDKTLLKEGISFIFSKATPVKAIYAGIVEYSGSEIEGYGKTVIISHPDDYFSLYAFLDNIRVDIGNRVKKGEIIGITGKKNPQDKYFYLHFQLRKGVNSVNPLKYIKQKK